MECKLDGPLPWPLSDRYEYVTYRTDNQIQAFAQKWRVTHVCDKRAGEGAGSPGH